MSKKCFVCGKGPMVTLSVKRTGSKLRSGKKRYITGKSKRRQLPNLHKVKLDIDGTIKFLDKILELDSDNAVAKYKLH